MNTTGRWVRQGSAIVVLDVGNGARRAQSGLSFELESRSGASAMPLLRRGSRGSAVSTLQARLTTSGFNPGPVDGVFGTGTDTAVRAFQRGRGLVADGIVGSLTWAALRRSTPVNPAPSPSPSPSPAPPPAGVAGRIVTEARRHIGFHEGPNNENPFSAHFGVPNVAWCAYFVSYVHTMAGVPLNIGSCDGLLDYVIDRGRFVTSGSRPGDIVIFDWTLGDHDPSEHVGIVETVTSQTVTTIEGNSSDGVNRRNWAISSPSIVGYGRLT